MTSPFWLLLVALLVLSTSRVSAFYETWYSSPAASCRTTGSLTSSSSRPLRRSPTLGRAGVPRWSLPLLKQPSRREDAVVLDSSSNENEKETRQNGETEPSVVQIESLSPDQIAELIEISFIQACLSLAQGYIDTLKLFIVAVKASYEEGCLDVHQLIEAVHTCPVQSANRPLMPEEEALRSTWIQAVHLMLDHIGHDSSSCAAARDKNNVRINHVIDPSVRDTYGPILDDIVQAKALAGVQLWNTNDFVKSHQDVLPDTIWEDPVEMAIVSQTIKVLYYTLVVLAEERMANLEEEDDMPVVAKPKIPRGTGFN